MKKLTANEIRNTWINYFKSQDHLFVPSASLIPKNDPSLLWINSGVATLKSYFSGKENPPSPRLTNSQKALRTNDFFNVGVTSRHHTLFEMLGNFSIGDYFKTEAINFAYDLLINHFQIDLNRLWFTIFEEDDVAYETWTKLGVDPSRILKCGRDRNFWDVGNGPCGPCTEIHYDRGEKYDPQGLGDKLIKEDIENDRYVEIWNIVFSQFNNDGANHYTELARKNIDTGAGLERIACISQDVPTNFDTDLFQPIIKAVNKHSSKNYDMDNYFKKDHIQEKINFAYRVISDHLRASVFAIADGAIPSNKERGYILRRLIRRAIVFGHNLGLDDSKFLIDAIDAIVETMKEFYPYLVEKRDFVVEIILKEFNLFKKTLETGLKVFNNAIDNNSLDDQTVFHLVDTYGFPIEMINELAVEHNQTIDMEAFKENFKKHQTISNANNNIKAMDTQIDVLMNLDVKGIFLYETFDINDAKIIKLFDKDWKPVEHLVGDGYVIFDRTPFYATSGGQLHDIGTINDTIIVDDVFKAPNMSHVHHVIHADLKLGQIVELKINEQDRLLVAKNHSVEHLLQASLQNNIAQDIKQEGAFKSPQKVTFDFSYHQKLTSEQLNNVQKWVNDIISQQIPIEVLNMDLDEAKAAGALGYFEEMYKKIQGKLRVIKMGDKSMELCGGTHAHNTQDIEEFRIADYYSLGSGSWRIEAITSKSTIENYFVNLIDGFEEKTSVIANEISKYVEDMDEYNKKYVELLAQLKVIPLWETSAAMNEFINWANQFKKKLIAQHDLQMTNELTKLLVSQNSFLRQITIDEKYSLSSITDAINNCINQIQDGFVLIMRISENKIQYYLATNQKFAQAKNINLNNIVKEINAQLNTRGGGKPFTVQGGILENQKSQLLSIIEQGIKSFNA